MASAALNAEAVAAVDSTGQAAEILDLPTHLRDALWRVDSAAIAPIDAPGGVLVAGMGGSAVGGRLAQAALGARLTRPFTVADGYTLPSWVGPQHLVLCASYSGGTEETLVRLRRRARARGVAARRHDRRRAGRARPPRRRARDPAAGRLPAAGRGRLRARVGARGRRGRRRRAVAARARSRRPPRWPRRSRPSGAPDGDEDGEAKRLARALHGTVPVVAGAELTAPVAYRWKCQINENAGLPAFASVLPELDHNEVVGWPGADGLGPFSAVFLEDAGAHPRNALRSELTAVEARGRRDASSSASPPAATPRSSG